VLVLVLVLVVLLVVVEIVVVVAVVVVVVVVVVVLVAAAAEAAVGSQYMAHPHPPCLHLMRWLQRTRFTSMAVTPSMHAMYRRLDHF
jgi:hypothetical protein